MDPSSLLSSRVVDVWGANTYAMRAVVRYQVYGGLRDSEGFSYRGAGDLPSVRGRRLLQLATELRTL